MGTTDFTVYGMKIQPGGAEDDTDPFDFCKQGEIIGVGWGGLEDRHYETADEVHQAHLRKAERRAEEGKDTEEVLADNRLNAPLRYLLKRIEIGDFVWIKEGSEFALCKVTGEWQVSQNLDDDEFDRFERRDIHHFRPVEWKEIPYRYVPGYARRKFSRQFGTMSKMEKGIDEGAKQVIKSLHSHEDLEADRLINRETIAQKLKRAEAQRIFDILGSEETEDIVLSYLQAEGWRIIKSSTSDSEAKIECEMRREEDGESVVGYLQVKTGSAGLNPDSYKENAEAGRMIFFVQSGIDVEDREGMVAIEPTSLRDYMVTDYNYLPHEPLLKLDFALN